MQVDNNNIQVSGLVASLQFYNTDAKKTPLLRFRLGCQRRESEPKEWYTIKMWGPDAVIANDHLTKGDKIEIVGQLCSEPRTDEYPEKVFIRSIKCVQLQTSATTNSQNGFVPANNGGDIPFE